jgi:hypothetical protein
VVKPNSYRLAEYLIVENAYGDLHWETHHGFGARKRGKCFVRGDVLFLQTGYKEEHGFLKGEFLDRLYRLPAWDKTTYFCTSYRIYPIKSYGKTGPASVADARGGGRAADKPSYRLGRYEITKKSCGQWHWRTHSGSNSMEEGSCSVRANILFIGSGKTAVANGSKKEFRQRLIQLPEWNQTEFYSPSHTIYDCSTGALCGEFKGAGREKAGVFETGDIGRLKAEDRPHSRAIMPPKPFAPSPSNPYLTFAKGLSLWFLKRTWLHANLVFLNTLEALFDTWRRWRR